ncbi:NADH dehydrogenase [Humibacillus sp. DSM 29435]|nr:NADH dehydrogenase [Humibacillus sp. DSM 29435]
MTSTTGYAAFTLWLLVALPAAAGGLVIVVPAVRRVAAPVAIAVSTVVVAASAVVAVGRPTVAFPFVAGSDFALGVDGLSALLVPTVAVVTLLVLVFAAADVRENRARFNGLMLLFSASASLTATALTLPTLLTGWEVMGATSYALIGFWWWETDRVSAGLTAFLTTRLGDLGLYLAAGAAVAARVGLSLGDLGAAAGSGTGTGAGWSDVIAAGMLVAALGKAAQLPFSFWLSRAMEGPSPVSALLHSAAMVAMGGYLLLRAEPLLTATSWAPTVTAWAGVLTALGLGAVALAQTDLKQLLAASTGSQLGFVVLAAGVGSVAGGTAQLVAHAATKALLFLAAGAWLTALGTKHLDGLLGVARRWPLVGWCATIGAASLAGLPPLSLWATKDAVLAAALEQSPWLYAAGLAAAALSAAYAAKIVVVIWRRPSAVEEGEAQRHLDEEEQGTREVTTWQRIPLLPLAAGAMLLGLLALPPLADAVARTVGGGTDVGASPLELAVSGLIAVVVGLAVWWWGTPSPAWAAGWLGLERAAHRFVVEPTLALARSLDQVDRRLDRGVWALAGAVTGGKQASGSGAQPGHGGLGTAAGTPSDTRGLAGLAARFDQALDDAVHGLTGRIRGLGQLARRPQTGQLHHYYLQAVAFLAALLLLLLLPLMVR